MRIGRYPPCVAHTSADETGSVHESGKIETLIQRNRRVLSDAIVMAAGFDPFLDRVRAALRENEISPAELITETFGPLP